MICYIRVVHVSPKADRAGEILPHSLIFPHALLALFDEGSDTVFLYLLFAVKSEELFDLYLNGQTVRIPTGFTGNHIALHGAVARDHILYDTGEDMTDMRLAVCRGGTVVKDIRLAFFACVHALFEDMIFTPEFFNELFTLNKVQVGRNLFVHSCLPPFYTAPVHVGFFRNTGKRGEIKKPPVRNRTKAIVYKPPITYIHMLPR